VDELWLIPIALELVLEHAEGRPISIARFRNIGDDDQLGEVLGRGL
jgi:hypothetical protein